MRRRPLTNLVSAIFITMPLGGFVACVGEDGASLVSTGGVDAGQSVDATGNGDPEDDLRDGGGGTDDAGSEDAGARGTVFVTTAKVDGAFAVGAASPIAAADAICANEALAAGLPGTYVAWLSYEDGNGTKFNAAARIGEMPYYLPKGDDGSAPVLFTKGKLDLVTNGSDVPLDRTATGAPVDSDENPLVAWVWTGTSGTGEVGLSTCKSWTSASTDDTGITGNARKILSPTNADWTSLGSRPCNLRRRLYCFQKP